MRIAICLDHSYITEKILKASLPFVTALKDAEVYVIHVIDQMLFNSTTGIEIELNEELQQESDELKELAIKYLGNIRYLETYGIPRSRIDELLGQINYDLLIIGTHARRSLGERLVGSEAEHLLRNAIKPILIIP